MTVHGFIRILRERWIIVVSAVVLGALIALSVFLVRPAQYTSQLSLYVSAQVGDNPQQAYQGAQLSEQRVKSYNELVTGDRVMSETIRRLGLPLSPDQLRSKVAASSALDSVIINISVTDRSPIQAAATANTVGTVVTEVVDELERPASPNGIAPVAVRIVQPAAVPDEPTSTGLLGTLILGTAIGLICGAGVAVVRNSRDTSIKSVDGLLESTGLANLGVVPYDAQVSSKPLVVHDSPQSPRAESFRQLRTNLQFVDVDKPKKLILFTSSMPGEGKSTTVANLAIALASTGSRTLVIEADLRRPKVSSLFGLDNAVGLTRVLSGRVRLQGAVQPWNGGAVEVLASGPIPPNPSELLASNQMKALLADARAHYDIVLIDSPPLLPVTDAAAIAPSVDGAVVVCRFQEVTRPQVSTAVSSLRAVGVEPVGTIFTMVPEDRQLGYGKYGAYYSNEVAVARPIVDSTQRLTSPASTASEGGKRQRPGHSSS